MKRHVTGATKYLVRKHRRSIWMRVVSALACVVVFCTTYALVLPAVTMENTSEDAVYCGMEEHQHTEECYGQTLICGQEESQEESQGHLHTEECYGMEQILLCEEEEQDGHTHAEECYETQDVLACGYEEGEGAHTHTEECYDEENNLICEREESDGHAHRQECQEAQSVLICGQEETEGHIHTDTCCGTETVLICGLESVKGHGHTDACYGEQILVCGYEKEHVHTLACYSNPHADVETAEDWENSFADVEMTGIWPEDLAAVAESQLGYAESADNYTVLADGETIKGRTRYGAWYGEEHIYDDWNTLFVMFCLNYANIPVEMMPQAADAQSWMEMLSGEEYGLYAEANGYVPAVGDLAFFDSDGDGEADRVGIVAAYHDPLLGSEHIRVIEGDREDEVQSVDCRIGDETILGYGILPVNPSMAVDSAELFTMTCEGEDYLVTVKYGEEAEIPEDAKLIAAEYAKDSETYQTRYAQAAEFYGWTEDKTDRIRLFHVGFYVEDVEIEPAAPVSVTITYREREESVNYDVTHFGKEIESVEATSRYEDGEQMIDFALKGFSDIMLLAGDDDGDVEAQDLDVNGLDGRTFALVNGSKGVAMLATSGTANRLDGLAVGANFIDTGDGSYTVISTVVTDTEAQAIEERIVIWTFESAGNNRYYLTTGTGNSKRYVKVTDNPKTLTLVGNSNEASAFAVTLGTDDKAGMVRFTTNQNLSINLYSPDFNNFCEYHDNSANEWFYLVSDVRKSNTVAGMTPNGTVINMFDYWTEERWIAGGDNNEGNKPDSGINKNKTLKFVYQSMGGSGGINQYKSDGSQTAGILQSQLVEKYPALNPDLTGAEDSLAYLFDPDNTEMEGTYRKTFRNVGGLLQVNDGGYYYYDSTQNFAELNEDTNQITLYDTWGVTATSDKSRDGQFFPFNKYTESGASTSRGADINHYFGMTLTSRFVQQYGGHTDAAETTATTFKFSGDDDVWIFIDNVLVADLGGIHDALDIEIDFSTGNVTVNGATTTIRSAFETAGAADPEGGWNGNTFADNTYHTLKFYYLERGGGDSNMSLQYNLASYPPTGIYKVNQYGDAVAGAKFAVYKADEMYEITDSIPVYEGATDAKGEMVFVDKDNMPYTLKELADLFGEYFVLKETEPPAGYRLVGEDIHLHITNGILICENTKDSGVWASPNLLVSAPNQLKLSNENTYNGSPYINYYDETGHTGTLFAVVLKYNGNGEDGLTAEANWAPVYGTDEAGYTVADTSGGFIAAAIDTAKRYTESQNVFALSASGQMQGMLNGMPGDIQYYYHMLPDNRKGETQYTVAYYWTSADSLDGADASNTFRVDAELTGNNEFIRTFGSTIEVPNMINRLFVQKFDESGNLVNHAHFAMYEVREQDGRIYYEAKDGTLIELKPDTDSDGKGEAILQNGGTGTYEVDGETAVITAAVADAVYTIEAKPYVGGGYVAITAAKTKDTGEDGTAYFTNMPEGTYVVREISAPVGYRINPAEIMVRVTADAVLANAGTADDGVVVARGAGYVASTMNQFSSEGQIDNTLTWIYTKLMVSPESSSFDITDKGNTSWTDSGIWAYLKYDTGAAANTIFNYTVNESRYIDEEAAAKATRRLYTDVGWSYLEVYQDYDYGTNHVNADANYEDWSGQDISSLFSRSVYIQVTDKHIGGDLEISKTVENAPADHADEFRFRVDLKDADGTAFSKDEEYIYTIYDVVPILDGNNQPTGEYERKAAVENGQECTGAISSGDTITLKNNQVAVIENLPAGTQYSVTEQDLSRYATVAEQKALVEKEITNADGTATTVAWPGTVSYESRTVEGALYWYMDEEGVLDTTSEIAYTNTYLPDLTLYKVDSTDDGKRLKDARFVLYYQEEIKGENGTETKTVTKYYKNGSWTELSDTVTEDRVALATGEAGTILFQYIPDGEYVLKELAAPAGYNLMKETVTFTVSGGRIITSNLSGDKYTDTSLTVPNSAGITLPQTGGKGIHMYTYSGLLFMAAAVMCGYMTRRRDERRGKS